LKRKSNTVTFESPSSSNYRIEGPKALDDDEISFMRAREDQQRLRYLEREIEDMKELEGFQVFTIFSELLIIYRKT
jgi:hypothetical protein